MTPEHHHNLQLIANTIRALSIDAVDEANSGHPGLPLGCAEIFSVLYGDFLRFSPKNPTLHSRDRFVLSAGHGSAALYSTLHIAGFEVSLEDIKRFRQLHSITPGHPEYRETPGVETTTGPLGQGIATATGMALAAKHKGAKSPHSNNHMVVVLAGDGCMMEGISSEASSLAGHLKLNNLVVIYDSNDICLDGPISETFTENVGERYRAYGWNVVTIDGHSIPEVSKSLNDSRHSVTPTLIIAKTTIGKGSPTYQGTSDVHGKPLGRTESASTKQSFGFPSETRFHVPASVYDFFNAKYSTVTTPDYPHRQAPILPTLEAIKSLEIKPNLATRAISQAILQTILTHCPDFIGGSADLSCSDSTFMKLGGILSSSNYTGRNIKYGVREFAMAAACSGLAIEGLRPLCGTFLTFSDYMKNAIRLAALMNLPVIYQFTHDSIFLGEDGPTHQPVEHLAALRSMPNLTVIRPADITETKAAWIHALQSQNPTALILTRQAINDSLNTSIDGAMAGGYIVKQESGSTLDFTIISTGSELSLALQVANSLEAHGKQVRVVSLPSFELFDAQGNDYRQSVLGRPGQFVSIEAQSSFGWHKYIGSDGVAISIDTFGLSAPAADLATHFGFTETAITTRILGNK